MKAKITRLDGVIIEVEGTPEEIGALLNCKAPEPTKVPFKHPNLRGPNQSQSPYINVEGMELKWCICPNDGDGLWMGVCPVHSYTFSSTSNST